MGTIMAAKYLWVDYTNHRGHRAWRQITELHNIGEHFYPPRAISPPGTSSETQPCILVTLADRPTTRTLALASCHRFLWQAEVPVLVDPLTISHHPLDPAPEAAGWEMIRTRMCEVEAAINRLASDADATTQDNERLVDKNGKLSFELLTAYRQRDDAKAEIEKLKRVNEEHVYQRDNARAEVRDLSTRLSSALADHRRAAAEAEAVRAEIGELKGTTSVAGRDGPWHTNNLSFHALRTANDARQRMWDANDQLRGGRPLGLLYRANEVAGEAGEACNKVKKWVREQLGIAGSRTTLDAIGDELADVVICVDLLAADFGIDLAETVRGKFNTTSHERGYAVELRLRDTVFVNGVKA